MPSNYEDDDDDDDDEQPDETAVFCNSGFDLLVWSGEAMPWEWRQ